MPKTKWLHYGGNPLAPLCRKRTGSYVPKDDRHWAARTRHLDDGAVAIDNNHLERQIKPWAMGRRAWMFVGSELAGQRAAIVMSRVQSARLNGHDPWAYLRDVLQRLPTQRASQTEDLLPHRWQPACDAAP